MKRSILSIMVLLLSLASTAQSLDNYMEGKLIYKLKHSSDKAFSTSIFNKIFESDGASSSQIDWSVEQKFPRHQSVNGKSANKNTVDLSLIYELDFTGNLDPLMLSRKLMSTGKFAYVEPLYEQKLAYVPNDTLNHKQYYLDMIQAYQAWNINKGDSNVAIGIIDTGVDTNHSDMVANYYYNHNDPINGIDDDNDGYVDNFLGWDTGNNDNDVSPGSWEHGMNVSGIASASTDNVTGISGVGFSCSILPVRIDDAVGRLVGSYEGIVYAADHGADIINNSWGGYQASAYAQDVVNYATNKGVLVVSAVGNDSTERPFYPAAYENVLSVGASEQQDFKKGSSNYGHWVDVFAPGEAMFTTGLNGIYYYNGGTSMASPVVAGVAGLVKSQFPNYSPKQIAYKILTTADNIDSLNIPEYQDKLGTGRTNAFRALTENFSPGIEMQSEQITDRDDDLYQLGDTLFIGAEFINYLSPANNVIIEVSGNNQYLEFLNSTISLGNLDSLQTKDNYGNPFLIKIKNNVPVDYEIELEFSITADNYKSKQHIELLINPDYINISHNLITTTLTSTGKIGYNDFSTKGLGFRYKSGNSHLFEASFMIGTGPTSVADGFRSENSRPDNDFQRISKIRAVPATKADFEYQATFNDANLDQPIGLEITQRNFVFDSTSLDNQVFFIYKVKNTTNSTINNIYAGIIADWDILDYSNNKVKYDEQRRMGISFSTDSNLYMGIKLLSDQNINHHAIDNVSGGNGGVEIGDGFTDGEKYTVLSSMRDSAGTATGSGNDILDVVSAGPVSLMPDSSVSYGFVLLAAESLTELINSADKAQQSYDQLALNIFEPPFVGNTGITISPNPAKEEIKIKFSLESKQSCSLYVYDSAGQLVVEKDYGMLGRNDYEKNVQLSNLRSGVYFLDFFVGNRKIQNKFVVLK